MNPPKPTTPPTTLTPEDIQRSLGPENIPFQSSTGYANITKGARAGDSQYDPGLIPVGFNLEEYRAQQQGFMDKAGNGVMKAAGSFGGLLGGVAGLVYGGGKALATQDASAIAQNEVSEKVAEGLEWMDNRFPGYQSEQEKEANGLSADNLLTVNFLFDGVIKNLGFSFGAGMVTKAASKLLYRGLGRMLLNGERGLEALNTAKNIGQGTSILKQVQSLATSPQFVNALSVAGGSMVAAGAEAQQESQETYQSILQAQVDQFRAEHPGMEIPEFRQQEFEENAKSGSLSAFVGNLALLSYDNFKMFGKSLRGGYKEALKWEATTKLGKLAQRGEKWAGRAGILFSPSEAREEGLQTFIQGAATDYYSRKKDPKAQSEVDDIILATFQGLHQALETKEGLTGIIAGGLSGGPSEALFSALQGQGTGWNKQAEQLAQSKQVIQDLRELKEQNPLFGKAVDTAARHASIQTSMEEAVRNKDIYQYQNLKHDALKNRVQKHTESGTLDTLKFELDSLASLSQEEFTKLIGSEDEAFNPKTVKEYVGLLKQETERLSKTWNNIETRFPGATPVQKETLFDVLTNITNRDAREQDLNSKIFRATGEDFLVWRGLNPGSVWDEYVELVNEKLKTNPKDFSVTSQEVLDFLRLKAEREQLVATYQDLLNGGLVDIVEPTPPVAQPVVQQAPQQAPTESVTPSPPVAPSTPVATPTPVQHDFPVGVNPATQTPVQTPAQVTPTPTPAPATGNKAVDDIVATLQGKKATLKDIRTLNPDVIPSRMANKLSGNMDLWKGVMAAFPEGEVVVPTPEVVPSPTPQEVSEVAPTPTPTTPVQETGQPDPNYYTKTVLYMDHQRVEGYEYPASEEKFRELHQQTLPKIRSGEYSLKGAAYHVKAEEGSNRNVIHYNLYTTLNGQEVFLGFLQQDTREANRTPAYAEANKAATILLTQVKAQARKNFGQATPLDVQVSASLDSLPAGVVGEKLSSSLVPGILKEGSDFTILRQVRGKEKAVDGVTFNRKVSYVKGGKTPQASYPANQFLQDFPDAPSDGFLLVVPTLDGQGRKLVGLTTAPASEKTFASLSTKFGKDDPSPAFLAANQSTPLGAIHTALKWNSKGLTVSVSRNREDEKEVGILFVNTENPITNQKDFLKALTPSDSLQAVLEEQGIQVKDLFSENPVREAPGDYAQDSQFTLSTTPQVWGNVYFNVTGIPTPASVPVQEDAVPTPTEEENEQPQAPVTPPTPSEQKRILREQQKAEREQQRRDAQEIALKIFREGKVKGESARPTDFLKAAKGLRRMLPATYSMQDIERLLDGVYANGGTWGAYHNKVVYLFSKSPKGTEFHEIFHAVYRDLLDSGTRRKVYTQMVKQLGDQLSPVGILGFRQAYGGRYDSLSDSQIKDLIVEEALADAFQEYVNRRTGVKGLVRKAFDRIREFFNLLRGRKGQDMDLLFAGIERGKYKSVQPSLQQGGEGPVWSLGPHPLDSLSYVEPSQHALETLFGEGSTRNSQNLPTEKVLRFAEKNGGELVVPLSRVLQEVIKGYPKLTFVSTTRKGALSRKTGQIIGGWFNPDNHTIGLNLELYAKSSPWVVKNKLSEVINHEILHSITYWEIEKNGLFKAELTALMARVQENRPHLLGQYALSSPHEFVTGVFTNPDFQAELASIPGNKGGKPTVWGQFVEAIQAWLTRVGIVDYTILEEAVALVSNHVTENSSSALRPVSGQVAFSLPSSLATGAKSALIVGKLFHQYVDRYHAYAGTPQERFSLMVEALRREESILDTQGLADNEEYLRNNRKEVEYDEQTGEDWLVDVALTEEAIPYLWKEVSAQLRSLNLKAEEHAITLPYSEVEQQQQVDEEDEDPEGEEGVNEQKERKFDANSFTLTGVGGLSQQMKSFLSLLATPIPGSDFKLPANVFGTFSLLQRNLKGLDTFEQMYERLTTLSQSDPTGVLTELVNKLQAKLEGKQVDSYFLNKFTRTFKTEYLNSLFTEFDQDKGTTRVYSINRNKEEDMLVNRWQKSYNTLVGQGTQVQEQARPLMKMLNQVEERVLAGDSFTPEETRDMAYNLATVGLDFSPGFLYQVLSGQELMPFADFKEELATILGFVDQRKNPFTVATSRLTKLATRDVLYRSDVYQSSYQNAEGETVFGHTAPAYEYVQARKLQDGTHGLDLNDPYYSRNFLVQHYSQGNQLVGEKQGLLQLAGGLREKSQELGVTPKQMDPRTQILNDTALYSQQGAFRWAVHEAKATTTLVVLGASDGYPAGLKDFVDADGLTTEGREALSDMVHQDQLRMARVTRELYGEMGKGLLPVDERVGGYHFLEKKVTAPEGLEALPYGTKNDLIPKALANQYIKAGYRSLLPTGYQYTQFPELNSFTQTPTEEEVNAFLDNFLDKAYDDFQTLLTSKDLGEQAHMKLLAGEAWVQDHKDYAQQAAELWKKNFLLHDLVVSNAMSQLIIGEQAYYLNGTNLTKRMAGVVAAGQDLGKGNFAHMTIADQNYLITPDTFGEGTQPGTVGQEGNGSDAQSYVSATRFQFIKKQLGYSNPQTDALLTKLIDGQTLTPKESDRVMKELTANPIKGVYFDGVTYIKTSYFPLFKEATSTLVNGVWEAIPGREKLHHLRELMEGEVDGVRDLSQPLIDEISQVSASKLQRKGVNQPGADGTFDRTTLATQTLENKYWRLQVENPSGKTMITQGTQLLQLLDSEMPDSHLVSFKGQEMEVGEVRKVYQGAMARNKVASFARASKLLTEVVNGDSVYLDLMQEMLRSSGAPQNTLDFFAQQDGKPKYSLDLPFVEKQVEKAFFSLYNKQVFSQKVPGMKLTLVSPDGFQVKDKVTGEYRDLLPHRIVDGKLLPAEVILSEELLRKKGLTREEFESLPEDQQQGIVTMLGFRIPTQSHHSMIPFTVVDWLPAYYGSVVVAPKEITFLSGADFDVDSLFVNRKEFRVLRGDNEEFLGVTFPGEETIAEDAYTSFKHYYQTQDKLYGYLVKKGLSEQEALTKLGLPTSQEAFDALPKEEQETPTSLSNERFEAEKSFIFNASNAVSMFTPASLDSVKHLKRFANQVNGVQENSTMPYHSYATRHNQWEATTTGKANVGGAANAGKVHAWLAKNEVKLTQPVPFAGKESTGFEHLDQGDVNLVYDKATGKWSMGEELAPTRIADQLSTMTSGMTDDAKERLSFALNLTPSTLPVFEYAISLGFGINRVLGLFATQPILRELAYRQQQANAQVKEKGLSSFELSKKLLNELQGTLGVRFQKGNKDSTNAALEEVPVGSTEANRALNDEYLLGVLANGSEKLTTLQQALRSTEKVTNEEDRELLYGQQSVLYQYIELEQQSKYFAYTNRLLNSNKEVAISVQENKEYFITAYDALMGDSAPFDVRGALGREDNVATNLDLILPSQGGNSVLDQTQSRFLVDSPLFNTLQATFQRLGGRKSQLEDFQMGLLTHLTMLVENQQSVSLTGKSLSDYGYLLSDPKRNITTVLSFLTSQPSLKGNLFLDQLVPKAPDEKGKGDNPFYRLEYNTRAKNEASFVDQLSEEWLDLYLNSDPAVVEAARELRAYLAIKDSFQFKNSSFIGLAKPQLFSRLSNGVSEGGKSAVGLKEVSELVKAGRMDLVEKVLGYPQTDFYDNPDFSQEAAGPLVLDFFRKWYSNQANHKGLESWAGKYQESLGPLTSLRGEPGVRIATDLEATGKPAFPLVMLDDRVAYLLEKIQGKTGIYRKIPVDFQAKYQSPWAKGITQSRVLPEVVSQSSPPSQQVGQLQEVGQEATPFNPTTSVNYSGDAQGSDKAWAQALKEVGVKTVNYRPEDLSKLQPQHLQEVEAAYQQAARDLGRNTLAASSFGGGLVRRDYLQAKAGDTVFAIGTILSPGEVGEKGYTVKSKTRSVDGGTGYAVQMGINLGKPVYVFDQRTSQWTKWDGQDFLPTSTPTLTAKFAAVGTRGLKPNGMEAIREVIAQSMASLGREDSGAPDIQESLPFTSPNSPIIPPQMLGNVGNTSELRDMEITPINVYSGDKNGFNNLSNLANRPFTSNFNGKQVSFHSPEQMYHLTKAFVAKDQVGGQKVMNSKNGFEALQAGRTIKGLDKAKWDAMSSQVLEHTMRESFKGNPTAVQLLLSTGNAPLTHKAAANLGKWTTEFPRILMNLRREFRTLNNLNTQTGESDLTC